MYLRSDAVIVGYSISVAITLIFVATSTDLNTPVCAVA